MSKLLLVQSKKRPTRRKYHDCHSSKSLAYGSFSHIEYSKSLVVNFNAMKDI